eukprot:TRINITY_DN17441_c0_g1_i1.p1 TRINITY_DN17441_c0_g1~~TRINITY_DN17441_c0_g1_i1.p1  ORF type:complete len:276 (+),score=48.17 TRINITY_DN17441_c0_g1_i1:44-829(+)
MSVETVEKEYDQGASAYDDIVNSGEIHHEVEYFSFFKALGDVTGKIILDVACGSGRYTKLIRDKKPASIVGLDLSAEMIKLAQETDSEGITYIKHDLAKPLPEGIPQQYDIVTSQYLLCYATTKDMLREMVKNCFNACKPGSTFVNLIDNPFMDPSHYNLSEHYGFTKKRPALKNGIDNDEEDGFLLQWHFVKPSPFVSEVWVWKPETYETIIREAGFVDFEWWGFSVPTQFLGDAKALAHITAAVMTPPNCGFSARRPAQ